MIFVVQCTPPAAHNSQFFYSAQQERELSSVVVTEHYYKHILPNLLPPYFLAQCVSSATDPNKNSLLNRVLHPFLYLQHWINSTPLIISRVRCVMEENNFYLQGM